MAANLLPSYEQSGLTGTGSDLCILLVSKTGSGKSSLGNALLQLAEGDARAFLVNHSLCSSDPGCQVVTRTIGDKRITVVDTPGTMDTANKDRALHEIASAIASCPGGFHVVLLVIRIDCRFTPEERMAVELVTRMFGQDFYRHCIVVFSHGDNIGNDEGQFHRHLHDTRKSVDFMNGLLNSCDNRVALVDNSTHRSSETQATQLGALRAQMDQLVLANSGATFSNQYFQLARQELRNEALTQDARERSRRDKFDRQVRKAGQAERARLEAEQRQELDQWRRGVQDRVVAKIKARAVADNNACFPGDATVVTPEGPVRLADLRLGQRVLCLSCAGRLVYSPVYSWAHRDPGASPQAWVTLRTAGGARLTLSADHLLPLATTAAADGGGARRRRRDVSTAARRLLPGQSAVWTLRDVDDDAERPGRLRGDLVTDVRLEACRRGGRGLFAPLTLCGNLLVDGVLASCYVDCLPAGLSHALLWPVRAAWRVWPDLVAAAAGCGSDGKPGWVRLASTGLLPWLRFSLPIYPHLLARS